jgi:GTP cyclohydrolase I
MAGIVDVTNKYLTTLLKMIGENPQREGLRETPSRVAKMWQQVLWGYNEDPLNVLKTFEAEKYDQLILVKNIELYSMCEHHMLPFIGKAHVGYIPDGRILGLSKIARVVDIFARRLQTQERLTDQIADALHRHLNPVGVACTIEAEHLCMRMRGVQKQNSIAVTTSLKGVFIDDSTKGVAARSEFIESVKD